MKTIFKLGDDLNEIIVVKIDFLRTLIASPDVDLSISEAEVVGGLAVEVLLD